MKKLSIVKIILRVLFSLIFLGLAIWFILPMRVAIFDIGNLLGLFLSICGLAVFGINLKVFVRKSAVESLENVYL